MGPFGVENRRTGDRGRTWRTGKRHREHESLLIPLHQTDQSPGMRQQSGATGPVAPETPVAEEVPGDQRRDQETAYQGQQGEADAGNEDKTG